MSQLIALFTTLMKPLLFLASLFFVFSALSAECQKIQIGEMTFLTDIEKPNLSANESAVFPYADEATILLDLATKIKNERGKAFSLVMDPFCEDGKSGLPLVYYKIGDRLIGSDINPRAVEYAKQNALLNHLEDKSCFYVCNLLKEGLRPSDAPGNTLWIANPPFALKAKGADLNLMRDGGKNGLALTLAFVNSSLKVATKGDVILVIGYSRISTDGTVEWEQELEKITGEPKPQMILLKGQKLWRDFDGEKSQGNPMPLSDEIFALKANPANQQEIEAYKKAAQAHRQSGYTQLGYYAASTNESLYSLK